MGTKIKAGDPIPLALQLSDDDVGAFPQATLLDASGTPLVASPVDLAHLGGGLYQDTSTVMPATDRVFVQFKVYSDSGHLMRHAVHFNTLLQVFERDFVGELVDSIAANITALVSGSLPGQELRGFIESNDELIGHLIDLELDSLSGTINTEDELVGAIFDEDPADEDVLVGFLQDFEQELVGQLDC